MNDSGVNALFGQMCKMVSDACKKVCHDNRLFLPSLHTIDANIGYGAGLYATLDGRKKGQPVNKNAQVSIINIFFFVFLFIFFSYLFYEIYKLFFHFLIVQF